MAADPQTNPGPGPEAGTPETGTRSPRPPRKGRLGKSLATHVDVSASAFPVNLLSGADGATLNSSPEPAMVSGTMTATAVFWDRDDTLIEDTGYLSDPARVKLLPGAVKALQRLAAAGFQNIIVTNQSGIARGLLDEPALARVHERLCELLKAEGAGVDAIYYCPYLDGPEAVVEQYRQDSDLRKPRPGMLAKASLERGIDLAGSWLVGNSLSDTQAGRAAGCRTVLVTNGKAVQRDRSVDFTARSPEEAAEVILRHTTGVSPASADAESPADLSDRAALKSAVVAVQEILSFLRMVDRRQQAEDFSLGRFVAVIMQMLAIAALIWAVFSMIRGEEYGAQLVRLLFSIALQGVALTCFVSSRK